MPDVDWKAFIEKHNLTREQFEDEILITAMAILEESLEGNEGVTVKGGRYDLWYVKAGTKVGVEVSDDEIDGDFNEKE